MKAMDDAYPLLRDDAEHRRLSTQAAFWAADADLLFELAGVRAGERAGDLGCGTLHIATALARRVGDGGSVFALDSDAPLVADIQAAATASNVLPMVGDAYATPWDDGSLDVVHARFLAAPCGRVDALIAEMLRVLRPGGLLLMQEPNAESWQLPSADWPRLRRLIRAGFRRRGGDFDTGRSLRRRLQRALGGTVLERRVRHTVPADHAYAALPLAFCDSLQALWRESGLVEERELASLREAVSRGLRRPNATATTFTLVQAWGRKATR